MYCTCTCTFVHAPYILRYCRVSRCSLRGVSGSAAVLGPRRTSHPSGKSLLEHSPRMPPPRMPPPRMPSPRMPSPKMPSPKMCPSFRPYLPIPPSPNPQSPHPPPTSTPMCPPPPLSTPPPTTAPMGLSFVELADLDRWQKYTLEHGQAVRHPGSILDAVIYQLHSVHTPLSPSTLCFGTHYCPWQSCSGFPPSDHIPHGSHPSYRLDHTAYYPLPI